MSSARAPPSHATNWAAPEQPLTSLSRNSLCFETLSARRGGPPRHSTGGISPQGKRPGRHTREALLFVERPLIRRIWGSVRSSPKGIPRSCLAPRHGPVTDARRRALWSVIDGRQPGRKPHNHGEMRTSNGQPPVPLSIPYDDDTGPVQL